MCSKNLMLSIRKIILSNTEKFINKVYILILLDILKNFQLNYEKIHLKLEPILTLKSKYYQNRVRLAIYPYQGIFCYLFEYLILKMQKIPASGSEFFIRKS
jgi:hypothetical protein